MVNQSMFIHQNNPQDFQCTGVDIDNTYGNIIYRRCAQQAQDPQHDPPTQPGPIDINQVQEDCMKDPKQPASRGHFMTFDTS